MSWPGAHISLLLSQLMLSCAKTLRAITHVVRGNHAEAQHEMIILHHIDPVLVTYHDAA